MPFVKLYLFSVSTQPKNSANKKRMGPKSYSLGDFFNFLCSNGAGKKIILT